MSMKHFGLVIFCKKYFIEIADKIQKIGYIGKIHRESEANEYA